MWRTAAVLCLMAALVVTGCDSGPKQGGIYVLSKPTEGSIDYPGGSNSVMLGEGSIVRMLDTEYDAGRRYLKVFVERNTIGPGSGRGGPGTAYLPADGFEGAPTDFD